MPNPDHDRVYGRRPLPAPRLVVAVVLVVAGAAAALLADAHPPRLDPHAVSWSALELRATKLFLTATAEVSLEPLPAKQVARALRVSSHGDDLVPAGPVGHLTALSKFGGRRTEEEVYFALGDGETFERRKRQLGRKPYTRSERFTRSGVHDERRAPAGDSEAKLEPAGWSDVDLRFDPRASAADPRVVVHPLVLFYLVSAAPLDQVGDRVSVFAYAHRGFIPVDLEVAEIVRLDVDFEERQGGETRARRGPVDALRIKVHDTSGADTDLSFLGLENGIEIFVERASRLPVLVRGSLGALGRLDIRLVSADRR